jgi:DME family drug/metabolite transporter
MWCSFIVDNLAPPYAARAILTVMSPSDRAARVGLLQVCLAGVLWGTGGLAVQVIRRHVDLSPLSISAWRMGLAAVVLVAASVATRQLAGIRTLLRTKPA